MSKLFKGLKKMKKVRTDVRSKSTDKLLIIDSIISGLKDALPDNDQPIKVKKIEITWETYGPRQQLVPSLLVEFD